jgi:hypothetical protein
MREILFRGKSAGFGRVFSDRIDGINFLGACGTLVNFCIFMQKFRLTGLLWEFANLYNFRAKPHKLLGFNGYGFNTPPLCGGDFLCAPSMGGNSAVKVRYALGSGKRRTKGPKPKARVSADLRSDVWWKLKDWTRARPEAKSRPPPPRVRNRVIIS